MKKILSLIFIVYSLTSLGQTKKEMIEILSYKIDSLQKTIINERNNFEDSIRKIEGQIVRLKESNIGDRKIRDLKIDSLNVLVHSQQTSYSAQVKRLLSDQEDLQDSLNKSSVMIANISKDLIRSNEENSSLISNRQTLIDSLRSEVMDNLKQPKSISYLKSINKANLFEVDREELAMNVKLVKTVKYYAQKGNSEIAYFEKILDGKVVLRGFAVSSCGDCAQIALSFYTVDGFLYRQEFYEGCSMEVPNFVAVDVDYFTEDYPSKLVTVEMSSEFMPEQYPDGIKNYVTALRSATVVPSNFSQTTTKPEILDCVGIRVLE
jgi:hypothetical protein